MQVSAENVSKLREASVAKYAEIGTMGSSAPVSKTQLVEALSVVDAPLSDEDSRSVIEVAKGRKTREQIKDYARKNIVGSQLSPDAKLAISRLTGAYRKPWARKSAVMLEVFLENAKLLKGETPKAAPRKRTPRKRAAKKA